MKKERSKKHRALGPCGSPARRSFSACSSISSSAPTTPARTTSADRRALLPFRPADRRGRRSSRPPRLRLFAWALVTILVTLLFGRVVCGWVCPLGAVHQVLRVRLQRTKFQAAARGRGRPGLEVLRPLFVLVGAVFSLDLAGYLDPLTFLTRSFALAVCPVPRPSRASRPLYGIDRPAWPARSPRPARTDPQRHLPAGVLGRAPLPRPSPSTPGRSGSGAGTSARRAPCSASSPLEPAQAQGGRGEVHQVQPLLHALPDPGPPFPNDKWKSSECIYCENCAAICPTTAITFPGPAREADDGDVDLSRRKLILTPCSGDRPSPSSASRRPASGPPTSSSGRRASLAETEFLANCVKCGECMKACPTNALQPALTEAGPEGSGRRCSCPRSATANTTARSAPRSARRGPSRS